MSEDEKKAGSSKFLPTMSFILAITVLFFGNNLYQQFTGHSFFSINTNDSSTPSSVFTETQVLPTSSNISPIPTSTNSPRPTQTQLVIQQEELGDNLITDGTFENGLGGWTYVSRHEAGIIYPAIGYSGNGVCSRQNLTENDDIGWVGIGRDVSVQAGKTYKYSAWVKWENATQFNAHAEWKNPVEYVFFQVVDGTNNNWQLWETEITVPNEVSQLRLAFWHGVINDKINVPGGLICVDEVSLRQIK